MLLTIANVLYVLVAVAMIALILMQRGAGAQAGSGFGAGASATVFGSRGASNFLTKATKWLAIVFFALSLGMAWYASRGFAGTAQPETDLGVMGAVPAAPEPAPAPVQDAAVPSAPADASVPSEAPQAPVDEAPAAAPAENPSAESATPAVEDDNGG